jgi:arginine metabolism regulation protein II
VAKTNQVSIISRFLGLLARTTFVEAGPRHWPVTGDVDSALDLPLFSADERSMEYIYGVTPMLANMLHKACQLAEYVDYYSLSKFPVPGSLRDACDLLGWEITSWNMEADLFSVNKPSDSMTLEIIRHQARAFHSALLIFYYRGTRIRDNSSADTDNYTCVSQYPTINLAAEVRNIWENLTLAEDLKDAALGGAKRAAPMSWPAFIGACEAVDRRPWVEWWTRVQEYRLGNFMRQWKVVEKLWAAVDADESAASDWRGTLRSMGLQVLPI